MPIRPPALDDRRFDDLVAELVARIPAHTPEWTNPRIGDPGRTLIDLFAWLGDALLYRANLIPERQRLVFLRLLGQPLRPARPAGGLVSLSPKDGKPPQAFAFRPGAAFPSSLPFEASDEFTALPITAAAFYKRAPVSTDRIDSSLEQGLARIHNNGAPVKLYLATPLFTDGQPASSGFDVFGSSSDRSLWLALLAPKDPDAASQPALCAATASILSNGPDGSRQLLNIGFVPALPPATPSGSGTGSGQPFPIVPDTTGTATPADRPAQIPHLWEITVRPSGAVIDALHPWQPDYLTLDEVADSTAGLTRAGILRLALPRGALLHAPANDVREDLNAGVGDRPPRLDDTAMASRLVAWIRLRPRPPQKALAADAGFKAAAKTGKQNRAQEPSFVADRRARDEARHLWINWIGVNAVAVEQLSTRENLIVGESNGAADQQFALNATAVEPETLAIAVEEDAGWALWARTDDLSTLDRDSSLARDARVFQLDAEAGTIRFGDGVRGRIPATGRRILVRRMRAGGGQAGNLPAGTLKSVVGSAQDNAATRIGPDLVVLQPLAFTGGAEAETLAEAERRIPALFRHRDRAVTEDDYRTLAAETPGAGVARVELFPRFKPQQRTYEVPGIVTVMALPGAPLGPAPNPRADRPFLEAVHAWLDARRPLGTEFYVMGCEYVPLGLSVALSVADGAATDTTLRAVKEALIRVLWPLPGGGFDGKGWRRKRAVSNRELAVEVARVEGVSEVNGINLFTADANGVWSVLDDARSGREQELPIGDWQFPELLRVVVAAESEAATELPAAGSNTNPYANPDAVAVPVVTEFCQ
jgi:predicted phage baseplate assembly protein